MLSSVATTVLNKVLGQYVEKFDSKDVDLQVWSGSATLENVKLKSDALDTLGLPVKIKVGFVGKIRIEADWKRLSSRPVVVRVSDVRVVASKKSDFCVTSDVLNKEAENANVAKRGRLDAWEGLMLEPRDDHSEDGEGYMDRLVQKIIDNAQVHIHNVHIRYEDEHMGQMYSVGIALRSLSAETVDENGKPQFFKDNPVFIRKWCRLEEFAIYLDTHAVSATLDSMASMFDTPLAHASAILGGKEQLECIVEPVNGHLKATLNKRPDFSDPQTSIPKIDIESNIPLISLLLSEVQYVKLLNFVSALSNSTAYGDYLRHKPSPERWKSPRSKWKWAIGCVKRSLPEKHTIMSIKRRKDDRDTYIRLYVKTLNAAWETEATKAELRTITEIEGCYTAHDVLYFRACAVAEVSHMLGHGQQVVKRKHMKNKRSWFGFGAADTDPIKSLTYREKEALHDTVLAPKEKVEEDVPAETVLNAISFKLGRGSAALLDAKRQSLTDLSFDDVSLAIAQRTESMVLNMSLFDLSLDDFVTKHTVFPSLIRRTPDSAGVDKPLFEFQWEDQPLSGKTDKKGDITFRSLQVVFSRPMVERVAAFFTPPKEATAGVDLYALEEATFSSLVELQKSTQAHLLDALDSHTTLELNVDVHAPTILIPETCQAVNVTTLVVELGRLRCSTTPASAEAKLCVIPDQEDGEQEEVEALSDVSWSSSDEDEEYTPKRSPASQAVIKEEAQRVPQTLIGELMESGVPEDMRRQYFDTFHITCSDTHIYLLTPSASTGASTGVLAAIRNMPRLSLLPPMDLSCDVFQCIVPTHPMLPKTAVQASIPEMRLQVSTTRLKALMKLVDKLTEQEQPTGADQPHIGLDVQSQDQNQQQDVDREKPADVLGDKNKRTMSQKLQVLLSFGVQRLTVVLTDDNDERFIRDMLAVNIENTFIRAGLRTFDTQLRIGVTSLSIEDRLQQFGGNFQYLLSTFEFGDDAIPTSEGKGNDAFVSIRFRDIKRDSPDYAKVDKELDIHLGTLIVSANPTSLLSITQFVFDDLLPSLPSASAAPSAPVVSDAQVEESKDEEEKLNHSHKKLAPRQPYTKLLLNMSFRELRVQLNAEDWPVARASVSGLRLYLQQYPDAVDLRVTLEGVSVRDLTSHGQKHPFLLHSVALDSGGHSADVTINTFDARHIDYPGFKIQLEGSLSGVHVCFLYRFVDELLQYVTTGPVDRIIKLASAGGTAQRGSTEVALVQSGAAPAMKLSEDIPRVKLSVRDVCLLLPFSSSAKRVLKLELSFGLHSTGLADPDQVTFHLSNLRVQSYLREKFGKSDLLYLPNLRVIAMKEFQDLDVHIDLIQSTLPRRHFLFLLKLLDRNIAERSVLVSRVYAPEEEERSSLVPPRTSAVKTTEFQQMHQDLATECSPSQSSPSLSLEQPEPVAHPLKVSLAVDRVQLELRKRHGTAADGLAGLGLVGLQVGYEMKPGTDCPMNANIAFRDVMLKDLSADSATRGVKPEFLKLFSAEHDQHSIPLQVAVRQARDGAMAVDVCLRAVTITFGGVIWAILDFFVTPSHPHNQSAPITNATDTQANDAEVVSAEKQESSGMDLTLKLVMSGSSLRLVEKPTSASSHALVVTWEVVVNVDMNKSGGTHLVAKLQDARVFHATVKASSAPPVASLQSVDSEWVVSGSQQAHVQPWSVGGSEDIVEQFSVVADLAVLQRDKPGTDDKEQVVRGKVAMDKVKVKVTYLDIRLVQAALTAMVPPALDKEDAEGGDSWDEGCTTEEDWQQKDARDSEQKASQTVTQRRTVDFKAAIPTESFGEQNIDVEMEGLSVVLINNALGAEGGVPFLCLLVPSIEASVKAMHEKRTILCNLDVQCDYFNYRRICWEPMLEPWSMQLRMETVTDLGTRICVQSSKPLQLNFSHAVLNSLNESMRLIEMSEKNEDAQHGEEHGEAAEFAERWLCNDTEIPLWLEWDMARHLVLPGERKALDLTMAQHSGADNGGVVFTGMLNTRSTGAIANIVFEGPWEHLSNVALDSVGMHTHFVRRVAPTDASTLPLANAQDQTRLQHFLLDHPLSVTAMECNLLVLVELALVDGQKQVSVHSSVCLQNDTSLPVSAFSITIPAHKMRWAPLFASRDAHFDVQPLSAADAQPTHAVCNPIPLTKNIHNAHRLLHLKGLDTHKDVFLNLQVTVDHSHNLHAFKLCPSLVVHNVLATDLCLGLSDGTEVLLEQGEEKSLLNVSCDMVLIDHASIPSSELTSSDKLSVSAMVKAFEREKEDSAVDGKMVLKGAANRRLTIFVDLTFPDGPGTPHVFFYAPYWVFNLSGLPLQWTDTNKSKTEQDKANQTLFPIPSSTPISEETEALESNMQLPDTHSERASMFSVGQGRMRLFGTNQDKMFVRNVHDATAGPWSKPVPIDAVGQEGGVIEGLLDDKTYLQVGVSTAQATGQFSRTRVVTLIPRFVVVNRMGRDVCLQEVGSKVEHSLASNQVLPLHFLIASKHAIAIRKATRGWMWTESVQASALGEHIMRMQHESLQPDIISINIHTSGATIYIELSQHNQSYPPFRVENRTVAQGMRFRQRGSHARWQSVSPGRVSGFAWDNPNASNLVLSVQVSSGKASKEYHFSIDKVRRVGVIKFPMEVGRSTKGRVRRVTVQLHAFVVRDGPVHIFTLSDVPLYENDPTSIRHPDNVVAAKRTALTYALSANLIMRILPELRQRRHDLEHELMTRSQRRGVHLQPRLTVQVTEARAISSNEKVNAYAVVEVDHSSADTKTVNSNNPRFDQRFQFEVHTGKGRASTFKVQLWAKRMIRDQFLGEVVLHLDDEELQLDYDHPVEGWYQLQGGKFGQVHLSLQLSRHEAEQRRFQLENMEEEVRRCANASEDLMLKLPKKARDDVQKNIVNATQRDMLPADMEEDAAGDDMKEDDVEAMASVDSSTEQSFEEVVVNLVDVDGLQEELQRKSVVFRVSVDNNRREIPVFDRHRHKVISKWSEGELFLVPAANIIKGAVKVELMDTESGAVLGRSVVPLSSLALQPMPRHQFTKLQRQQRRVDKARESVGGKLKEDADTAADPNLAWHSMSITAQSSHDLRVLLNVTRFSAARTNLRPFAKYRIELAHAMVSLIDSTPAELINIGCVGLNISLEECMEQQTVEFGIEQFQIDSGLPSAKFSIVVGPSPVPFSKVQPMLQFSANKTRTPPPQHSSAADVSVFQYLALALQETDLRVEEDLMWSLLEFADIAAIDHATAVVRHSSEAYAPVSQLQSQSSEALMFLSLLHIHPMAFNLSFRTSSNSRDDTKVQMNPLMWLLRGVGAALGSIDSAPIRMNSLLLENAMGGASTIMTPIIMYYAKAGARQFYKLLGSFDVIGNPVELVSNLGAGVADFFYMPAEALMRSPQDFGAGLSEGSKSLVKNTVKGFFTAGSKITGSLAKGVAMLSMDDDFMQNRREEKAGFREGVRSLGRGVYHGATGVVLDPVKGASKGFGGFVKGVGKGLVGVVAKPVSGVLDLGNKTFQGVANRASNINVEKKDGELTIPQRVRPPRFVSPDGVLGTYSRIHAIGQMLLQKMGNAQLDLKEKVKWDSELVIHHEIFNEGSATMVLSSQRLVVVSLPLDPRAVDYSEQSSYQLFVNLRDIKHVAAVQKQDGSYVLQFRLVPVVCQEFKKAGKNTVDIVCSSELDAQRLRAAVRAVLEYMFPAITRALYGARDQWTDVTEKVNQIISSRDTPQLMQPYDKLFPKEHMPKRPKVLLVSYETAKGVRTQVFQENEWIFLGFDNRKHSD